MEEIESETKQKQTLLQTEIIDKNFNKEEFIKFCLTKKEGGDDINNWALEELKEIINEFVSQSAEKKDIDNKENLLNSEKKEKDNEEKPKVIKEQTIKCKKLLKTALNDKKITVTIKNPKEMDGGLFGKNIFYMKLKLPQWDGQFLEDLVILIYFEFFLQDIFLVTLFHFYLVKK